jgi:putative membrane protein
MKRSLIIAAAMLCSPIAIAQPVPASDSQLQPVPPAKDPPDATAGVVGRAGDVELLQILHGLNLAQIKAGSLADERSSSKRIKEYGRMLVRDHTQADALVLKEAKRMGVTLAADLPIDKELTVDRLADTSTKSFNQVFLEAVVDEQEHGLKDIQDAAKSNGGVQSLCEALTPVLRVHASDARRLQERTASAR